MEIEIRNMFGTKQTIEQFADEHGLTMLVERMPNEKDPNSIIVRASFKNTRLENGSEIYGYSKGRSDAAIRDYAKQISGKRLRFQSETLQVPVLILWPKREKK